MSNEATERMVYIPCRCGSAHHFIRIQGDPDTPNAICVEFLSRGFAAPLWIRMKHALRHLFWREELVHAELFIDCDALNAAIEVCGARTGWRTKKAPPAEASGAAQERTGKAVYYRSQFVRRM